MKNQTFWRIGIVGQGGVYSCYADTYGEACKKLGLSPMGSYVIGRF